MAFYIFVPKKLMTRHSLLANIYWNLINLVVTVFLFIILAGYLPLPVLFTALSFLSMTSPSLIILNMVYEIHYSMLGLVLPLVNAALAIVNIAGYRLTGYDPALVVYTPIEIVFLVSLVIGMFLYPVPTLILSHYKVKIPRFTFHAYVRFLFSNAYILFLVLLPEFSVLLLNERPLYLVETFLPTTFVFAISVIGFLRADVEMRLRVDSSLLEYFFHPRYLFMLINDALLALSSAIIYAIRIYSVQMILDHQVAFGITQTVLLGTSMAQKFTMVYSGLLFSNTYTSKKKQSSFLEVQAQNLAELQPPDVKESSELAI